MPARITLAHEDIAFADLLAEALRAEGHEVVRVAGQGCVVTPPQTDNMEIAISQATGRFPGLRIRLAGVPAGKPYAGALAQLLADPVDVERAVAAVKLFVS